MSPRSQKQSSALSAHRSALAADLAHAITHEQLTLEYQPKYRTRDRKLAGFEALVRWRHRKLGLIPPDLFIPVAETSGLISKIGQWVLEQACLEAARWPQHLRVAVNVSPLQFRNPSFAASVAGVLMKAGLSPRRLELEITETSLVDDLSEALSALAQLKALGVQLSMDDFGVGYSNLSLLQSFRFDILKIDGSFISNIDHNPQTAGIVRAIISLARAIGARVTAERVETEEQYAFLAGEDCDEIQGFLVGHARPISAYREEIEDSVGKTIAAVERSSAA